MTGDRSTHPRLTTEGVLESDEEAVTVDDHQPETLTFAEWRRTRPVAGALLLGVGGVVVAWPLLQVFAGLQPALHDALGLLVGSGIVLTAVAALVRPDLATRLGLVGIVLSVLSFPVSFGGYLVGMLVAAAGSILCFAWTAPPEDDGTEQRN